MVRIIIITLDIDGFKFEIRYWFRMKTKVVTNLNHSSRQKHISHSMDNFENGPCLFLYKVEYGPHNPKPNGNVDLAHLATALYNNVGGPRNLLT